jgi:hypothetical protein
MPDVRGFGLDGCHGMQPLRFAAGDRFLPVLFWNDVSRREVLLALRRRSPADGSRSDCATAVPAVR